MTTTELKKLVKIAQENIPALEERENLEARDNDSDDFFETSVWCLKDALIAAYELGKATASTPLRAPADLNKITSPGLYTIPTETKEGESNER